MSSLTFCRSRTNAAHFFFATVFLKVNIFSSHGIFDLQLVTVTASGRTAVSATTQLENATAGQTSEVAIATAVTKAWWASLRVLSATAIQMARGFYLVWATTYATARLR